MDFRHSTFVKQAVETQHKMGWFECFKLTCKSRHDSVGLPSQHSGLKSENHEFKVNLSYTVSSRPAWDI